MQNPTQKQGVYAVADLETTGLLPGYHGIVQVCIVVLNKDFEVLDTFETDVNPPTSYVIDPQALEFNGMTLEQIKLGISYPDAASQILTFLDKYFDESPTWIGQFYPFDFAGLLDMMIKTNNNEGFLKFFSNKFLDTKVIAGYLNLKAQKENNPLPFPTSLSLSNTGGLKDTLGVSQTDFPAHTALGDVLATREVLMRLLGR
jgi:DNA polymerase III epsilon subunit-like protein